MLLLKPGCEHCNIDLPPDSLEAMICSFECTFCRDCVERVLGNVCPNCGGGFERRPQRVATAWRDGVSLAHAPASEERVYDPVDPAEHATFAERIREYPARRTLGRDAARVFTWFAYRACRADHR